MRLTRCFIPTPLSSGSVVTLPAETAARLTRVLRLRPGAAVTLFDGRGGEYQAQLIDSDARGVRVQVAEHVPVEREGTVRLVLLQCVARGDRMDWIVQKATELGVTVIVPVISRYSVVQLDEEARVRRVAHWQAVSIGACEQCGRNRLPELRPVCDLPSACAAAEAEVCLLLSPEAPVSLPAALAASAAVPHTAPPSVALLIGPEGGLATHELEAAQTRGFRACRLGPRILRAETAPVAALAAIQAVVGDFI